MTRNKEQVKREILAAIDRRAEQIIGLGEQIGRHPELGFKEVKTARLVEETFDGLVVSDHPLADLATGAAHACGHNAQIAGLLGAAMGLVEAQAMRVLAGR